MAHQMRAAVLQLAGCWDGDDEVGAVVGRQLMLDGKTWWIKAKLDDERWLVSRGEGYRVENVALVGSAAALVPILLPRRHD